MREPNPIACSLDAQALQQRLESIAEVGAESLISRREDGRGQVLRFRRDSKTRKRLQEIVAAESACCPFLRFSLDEDAGELLLSISADEEGHAVAAELTAAFTRS